MNAADLKIEMQRILGGANLTSEWNERLQAALDSLANLEGPWQVNWDNELELWNLTCYGQPYRNVLGVARETEGRHPLASDVHEVANLLRDLATKRLGPKDR